MTLIDWRKNPERRSLALDMLSHHTTQEMLAVMESEHPARRHRAASDGFGATLVLGQIEGFQEALDMLRSFAEPLPAARANVPVTWGADPEDNQLSK